MTRRYGRGMPRREQAAGWRAVAAAARVNGDWATEVQARNTARLILGLPPLRRLPRKR